MMNFVTVFLKHVKRNDLIIFLLITLACFTLLINPDVSRVSIVLLVLFLIIFQKGKKGLIKDHMSGDYKWVVGAFLFYYVLNGLGLLYTPDLKNGFSSMGTKVPLLLCPLMFLLIPERLFSEKNKKIFFYSYLIGCILFALCTLGFALFKVYKQPDLYPSAFYREAFLGGRHPSYISLYYVFGILFAFDLFYLKGVKIREKIFLGGIILFFTIYSILLGSRAGFICLAFCFLFYIVFFLRSKKKRVLGVLILAMVTLGSIILLPKVDIVQKRLNETKIAISKYQSDSESQDPRIALWRNTIPLLDSHLIFGYGTGSKRSLRDKIVPDEFKELNDPHNQYLLSFLESGIIGFVSCLSIFLSGLWVGLKKKNIPLFISVFFFSFHCFFESMFERSLGTLFFSFLCFLLLSFVYAKEKQVNSIDVF